MNLVSTILDYFTGTGRENEHQELKKAMIDYLPKHEYIQKCKLLDRKRLARTITLSSCTSLEIIFGVLNYQFDNTFSSALFMVYPIEFIRYSVINNYQDLITKLKVQTFYIRNNQQLEFSLQRQFVDQPCIAGHYPSKKYIVQHASQNIRKKNKP